MTWELTTLDAQQTLLDRQIIDSDGTAAGKVDDLEITFADDGTATITAILCGPTALGPRLGGRLGTWWVAIARRLRPGPDPEPVRIPFEEVTGIDPREVRLGRQGPAVGTHLLRDWLNDKVITRLPGGVR
jgi:sporulation protein YlmC with PRC-barrel domain